MDYKLFEQYLIELAPPEVKAHWRALVDCLQTNSWLQYMIGMNSLYPDIRSSNLEVRTAAINGLFVGMCLRDAWVKDKECVEHNLKGFLEAMSKKRGENVIDFYSERAKLS